MPRYGARSAAFLRTVTGIDAVMGKSAFPRESHHTFKSAGAAIVQEDDWTAISRMSTHSVLDLQSLDIRSRNRPWFKIPFTGSRAGGNAPSVFQRFGNSRMFLVNASSALISRLPKNVGVEPATGSQPLTRFVTGHLREFGGGNIVDQNRSIAETAIKATK